MKVLKSRGSIIERGNSYVVKISLGRDPATGKYLQHWESFKTSGEAKKRLPELLRQIDTGLFMRPGKATVADYLQQWLKDIKPTLAPRTAEGYEYIVTHHLAPALKNIALTQLKPEHLKRLLSEKLSSGRKDGKGGLSARTVRYISVTIKKALKDAVRLGLIVRNPADAIEPPKLKRHDMKVMSESDIHLFLEYARETQYYSLFFTLLFTGLRRSEALALRWSDVDLNLGQLSVTRTIHQLHTGEIIFSEPKTAKSRRLVSLSPATVDVLREHRVKQLRDRRLVERGLSDDDIVFSQYDGKPLLPDSITHAWSKLAAKCGLKGVRLHDSRHSHASLLLKQNVHPAIVQQRLGHASIQTTIDVYSHIMPGLQQAAATRFDSIIQGQEIVK